MLTGEKIIKEVENGNIIIEPFRKDKVNPNSYNLRLSDELVVYTEDELDCKKENRTKKIKIPKNGYMLEPGEIYLASTEEYTETNNYVPMLSGRSSIGRVGLHVHISSGFGNIGYKGAWTLSIAPVIPIKVYPGMEICQIYYYEIIGDSKIKYDKGYNNQGEVNLSHMYREF